MRPGVRRSLLAWHVDDPVDDLERRRNTVVYLFQGNRNPFIDHPAWVAIVYGVAAPDSATGQQLWINEFHYDNVGKDEGEFVEVAGTAGLDLTGWRLIGYNGAGGRAYRTIELSGTIPDQAGGFGARAFDFPALQNGSPDGIALVDPDGNVVHFISYEGTFSATDGPAKGMVAPDIGVFEPDNTPIGQSLQLTGTGCGTDGFTWSGPAPATRGALNAGQSVACP